MLGQQLPVGHNGSGNVHVHIVINSLRIEEVPFMPYMDRPCDTQPGMKHRCTNAAMEYFRAEVMEMCHDAGLYQIDLLNGSKNRVTEREYWAKKKGQLALDEENAVLVEQGLPIKQTKFETDKDKLREEIRKALSDAFSFEDFAEKLLRRGITVKGSRGRLSYLTPDRTKAITARKLGDDFDKTAVFAAFVRNAKQVRAKKPLVHSAPTMQDFIKQQNSVSRMVDMEAAKAKGKGYEHWAKINNIKQMSKTLNFISDNGIETYAQLEEFENNILREFGKQSEEIKAVETEIKETLVLIKNVEIYMNLKPVYDAYKQSKNKTKYQEEHSAEIILFEKAIKELKEANFPHIKDLRMKYSDLSDRKKILYSEYKKLKQKVKEIHTIKSNIDTILGASHRKDREKSALL